MSRVVAFVAVGALALGVVPGPGRVASAGPCAGFVVDTWCKREVPDTQPQEWEIEFACHGDGTGCVAGVNSDGGSFGNLGKGSPVGANNTKSAGKARSTKYTKIQASTTVKLKCNDGGNPACQPSLVVKTGKPGQTDSTASDYIPNC